MIYDRYEDYDPQDGIILLSKNASYQSCTFQQKSGILNLGAENIYAVMTIKVLNTGVTEQKVIKLSLIK